MVFHYRVRAGVTVVIALVLAQCVAEGAHAPCRIEKSENVSLFLCSRYFHGRACALGKFIILVTFPIACVITLI